VIETGTPASRSLKKKGMSMLELSDQVIK
jgi:hypothetical protein